MFIRALISFLILPGVLAGVIPAWIASADTNRGGGWTIGFGILGLGIFLLLWCVRDFFVSGRGTLAPWDPPKRLVIVGLYRWVRNPMYIGVLTLVFGWSIAVGSRWLAVYARALAIMFHLRVVLGEEPWLQQQFGADWMAYSASVSRWLPQCTRRWRKHLTRQCN
jgi:protein-S-isoprenylcysteine O-methyltransferase Ste14